MMKKFISLALALVMVFSMAISVSAGARIERAATGNAWYMVIYDGFTGVVVYSDNRDSWDFIATEDGKFSLPNQSDFRGSPKIDSMTPDATPAPTPTPTPVVETKTYFYDKDYNAVTTRNIVEVVPVEVITSEVSVSSSFGWLANQRNQQGPAANFVTVNGVEAFTKVTTTTTTTIVETTTVTTTVTYSYQRTYTTPYGGETTSVRTESVEVDRITAKPVVTFGKPDVKVATETENWDVKFSAQSQALPNGSATRLGLSFADERLADFNLTITYNGNNNNGRAALGGL